MYLVNDSCFCISSLKDIALKNSNERYWGITDSYEFNHHVQSYFIGIKTQALIQKVISFFIQNNFVQITNKNDIIQKGEIGLSKFVASLGIAIHAEFSRKETFCDLKYANSAHAGWKKLRALGCPIIKKTRL
jgi:lipopolysaccharide biosynthesis protein